MSGIALLKKIVQRSSGMLLNNAFRTVPISERVETYTCNLPKASRNFIIKKKIENMTQLIEIAQNGYFILTRWQMIGLIGFKTSSIKPVVKVEKMKDSEELTNAKVQKQPLKRGFQRNTFEPCGPIEFSAPQVEERKKDIKKKLCYT